MSIPAGCCREAWRESRRLLSDGVKRNLRLERQRQLAREILREQADTLQELAKR